MTSISTDDAGRLAQMHRELLEQQVRAAASHPAIRPATVTSRTASGPLPLSASQSQLWYLSQLAPDSRAFNEVIEIRKTGGLEVDALRRALSAVVARHDALRTTFDSVDGVPHQIVWEPTEVDLPVSDFSDLRPQDAVARAVEIVAADSLPAYDLSDGPLIRPRLVRVTEEDHRLYLGLHHLIWDGTTLKRIVFPELVAFYRSYTMGLPSSLADPEAQYADYTTWQLDWLRRPEAADRITRWRGRLAGVAPSQLPLDYPRPPRQRFVGGTIPLMGLDDRCVRRRACACRAAFDSRRR